MELNNRADIVEVLTSRVIENAPLRELIRVYGEAVTAAIAKLSDAEVVQSIVNAGYTDLLDQFGIVVDPEGGGDVAGSDPAPAPAGAAPAADPAAPAAA